MTTAAAASSVGGLKFRRSGLEPDWRWLGSGWRQTVLLVHSLHLGWRSNNDQEDREEYQTIEQTKDNQSQQNQKEISAKTNKIMIILFHSSLSYLKMKSNCEKA